MAIVPMTERAFYKRVKSSPIREELMKTTTLFAALVSAISTIAVAEQPDRSRLIGSPIYSSDGAEVGTITDVNLNEAGGLLAVRIDAGARLGFGTKQIQIPGRSVTIVRGVAVLDVPNEAVEQLPSATRDSEE
jgi:sporulation protein YlmC with PRC-barrel domain